MDTTLKKNLHWFSILLRLSIGSLFLIAAINKMPMGVSGTIAMFQSVFEKSLLPSFFVTAFASVIIFVEVILGVWLLSGFKLRLAWIISGLTMVSLAVGMAFAMKYDVAGMNYIYVFFCGVGLVVSDQDRWKLGA